MIILQFYSKSRKWKNLIKSDKESPDRFEGKGMQKACEIANKETNIIKNADQLKEIHESIKSARSYMIELKEKFIEENEKIYHEYLFDVDLEINIKPMAKLTKYEAPAFEELQLVLKPNECTIL